MSVILFLSNAGPFDKVMQKIKLVNYDGQRDFFCKEQKKPALNAHKTFILFIEKLYNTIYNVNQGTNHQKERQVRGALTFLLYFSSSLQ